MTLEDQLIADGSPVEPSYACAGSGCTVTQRRHPPFALEVVKGHAALADDVYCHSCLMIHKRPQIEKAEKAVLAALPKWDSPKGQAAKDRRNLLVNEALWSVMPGSPLTKSCQMKWENYIRALHRISLDHPDPDTIIWPEPPPIEMA